MIKEEILNIRKERLALINELDNFISNNEENKEKSFKEKNKEYNIRINELGDKIIELILNNLDSLEFDFIMVELSHLGQAPNLLYDDNGLWAVTGDGYQTVVYGDEPQDVESSFFIEASQWKPTPKEALVHYLSEE